MSVPRFKKLESGRESLATALVDYVSFLHRDQGGAGPVQQIPPPISDDGAKGAVWSASTTDPPLGLRVQGGCPPKEYLRR
jgi:hypothetical protein